MLIPDDEFVEKALEVEKGLRFVDKLSKLVWRGSDERCWIRVVARNGAMSVSFDWDVKQNLLPPEDHCSYQFIAHIEGE